MMLEKRGCQWLVYPQNWTSATGQLSNFASSLFFCSSWTRVLENAGMESEAHLLRGKLSLCCFDVYIATTYPEREKGEKSR